MSKKSQNKRNKHPIIIKKTKKGESYWYRLPTDLGRKWKRLGASWEACSYRDAVRAYKSITGDIAKRKFDIRASRAGARFDEFVKAFIEDLRTKKDDTAREELFVKHFYEFFNRVPLTAITPSDVKAYIDSRLKKVSPSTARKEFYFLRKIFGTAANPEWWDISNLDDNFKNPCTDVTPPPKTPPRHRVASEEELQKLLGFSPSPVIKSIILFAIYSGCRQGEILSLQESQVNWDIEYIYWEKTKSGKPKNLPLSPTLIKILKEVPRPEDSPYFFCSPKLGKPYTREGFKRIFKRMVNKAEIEDFHFHDLRRVFGTRLAELGFKEKDIAELLGHSSTESTGIYIEISEKRKREAIEKVYFNGLQ